MNNGFKIVSVLFLAAFWFVPLMTKADGGFVTEKFVWDKHKDINEPAQKAIIVYDAGCEDLILQVKYEGPINHFGWLIPVPNLPKVKEGSMKCFYELSQYTQEHFDDHGPVPASAGLAGNAAPPPPVKVIEAKTIGAYDIAVLSAQDSDALKKWLHANDFYLPPDKYDVVDSYIKRNWYFVAVKINLARWFPNLRSTADKLAAGELNPLQISFASDRCIFPLKISSINGKPSEVQVYVLSPGPLLEPGMLQEHLPLLYSNDLAWAEQEAQGMKAGTDKVVQKEIRRFGEVPPDLEVEEIVEIWNGRPEAFQLGSLSYARVTRKDLPECRRLIPALGNKSWWLKKDTWTFQPRDMRDLTFEPAVATFQGMLGSRYGYFAAAGLCSFGSDGLTVLLQAMHDPNAAVRADAASAFDKLDMNNADQIYHDGRLTNAASAWLKDPDPSVRLAGLDVLNKLNDWNALKQPGQWHAKMTGYLLAPVQDPNTVVRATAVMDAGSFQNYPLSQEVLMALLHNSAAYARGCGVTLLYRNALERNKDKQSVALALPMLNDPNRFVVDLAGCTLRALTGQDFADDETNQWNSWWNRNKDHFVAERRPSEFFPHPLSN